jgi:hypothetical protein
LYRVSDAAEILGPVRGPVGLVREADTDRDAAAVEDVGLVPRAVDPAVDDLLGSGGAAVAAVAVSVKPSGAASSTAARMVARRRNRVTMKKPSVGEV